MTKLHLIYIHGFDSTSNSIKGQVTRDYCHTHHPDIKVHCPNLNIKPSEVIEQMTNMIENLQLSTPVVLIGSSFGGYFSTLLSNITGVSAFLLNPSTQPQVTLARFYSLDDDEEKRLDGSLDDKVFYTTVGGWQVTYGDMRWVKEHSFTSEIGKGVNQPDRVGLLVTTGDEVIPYGIAKEFYGSQANGNGISKIHIAEGDDHRIREYESHLPMIIDWAMHWA